MINFIQQFFLNAYLIFLILLAEFVLMSFWALRVRKEYIGYGLGWLIGIFGVVIYGALVGDTQVVEPAEETVEQGMNILQVIIPSMIGIVVGLWMMSLIKRSEKMLALRPVVVAILTTVSFWLLIFLAIAAPYVNTQRMIGLFTWAFGIGALMMLAVIHQQELLRRQNPQNRSQNPDPNVRNLNNPQPRNVPQAKIEERHDPPRFGDRN